MTSPLENESSQTPVTALTIRNILLFSGQGVFLRVYNHESAELLSRTKIFESQIIHGITVQSLYNFRYLLLVWGGRQIAAVTVASDKGNDGGSKNSIKVAIQSSCSLPDWILDVSFRPKEDDLQGQHAGSAVLVTAHNVLYQVNMVNDPKLRLSTSQLKVGPRCILYSAHLKWSNSSEISIASGTAFGEIVVWSYSTKTDDSSSPYPTLILIGHEGSIFGVQISDPIGMPSRQFENYELIPRKRFLTSCSDDRTIRVWDITELEHSTTLFSQENESETIHPTGFLSNLSESASKDCCLAVAMGHISRIWSINYVYTHDTRSIPNPMLTLLSVGEDATCQRWALNQRQETANNEENAKQLFELKNVESSLHHSGKNIWSVALSSRTEDSYGESVITGGADAGIISCRIMITEHGSSKIPVQWDLQDVILKEPRNAAESEQRTIQGTQPGQRKRNKFLPDCFRSYAFVNDETLVVTTNNGLVLLASESLSQSMKPVWQWNQLTILEELKGYSVASSLDGTGHVFFGTGNGSVFVYNPFTTTLSLLLQVKGKVAALFAHTIHTPALIGHASLLVTYQGYASPQLLSLKFSNSGEVVIANNIEVAVDLFSVSPGVITSFTHIITSADEDRVFMGCRDGGIILCDPQAGSLTTTINRAHGKEAVTSLHWIPAVESLEQLGWLLSVGRDGTLTVHQFSFPDPKPFLVHKLALPFGPNIEGIYAHPQSNEICAFGFDGKNFVVHNISASQNIMTVECGGAHRVWVFRPRHDDEANILGGTFAWTKASKLNVFSCPQPSRKIIENGSHGREMKACAVAPTSLLGPSISPILATGAEDTEIRLSYYSQSQAKFYNLSVLRRHVTGVQSLQWSSDGNYLFGCGGYEEFFVWRLRTVPGVIVGVVCESICPLNVARSDLRITSFAIRNHDQHRSDIDETGCATFLIAMVYSNSVIKLWNYSSSNGHGTWNLLTMTRYTSACITQIFFLECEKHIVLLTAATDGHLVLWTAPKDCGTKDNSPTKISNSLSLVAIQQLHQNSIKSMSMKQLDKTTTLVLTSGDDNGLGVSLVYLGPKPKISSLIIPRAHAASINATSLYSLRHVDGRQGQFEARALSGSNDQRVKSWSIHINLTKAGVEGVDVKRIANRYSAVADISDMAVFPMDDDAGESVLLSGVGMEVWQISK